MTYDEALKMIRDSAYERGLGVKTYCLVYLGCDTVPEAVAKLQAATHD